MDLSFATDSKVFSKAVEQLRAEKMPIDEHTIRERYMQLIGDVPVAEEPTPVEEPTEEVVVEKPKRKRKNA